MRIILFFLLAILITSCGSRHFADKGNVSYNNLSFDEAIKSYEKSLSKKYNRQVSLKLAEAYYRKADFKNALLAIQKMELSDSLSQINDMIIPRIYMANEEYAQAKEYLMRQPAGNSVVEGYLEALASMDSIKELKSFEVKVLDITGFEGFFSPFVYQDSIYFTGVGKATKEGDSWTGDSYTGLYKSKLNSETSAGESSRFEMGGNNKYHIGTISFHNDGKMALVSASLPLTKGLFFKEELDETINIGIYEVWKTAKGWDSLKALPFVNREYSYMHPSFDEPSQTLYFASDMKGGLGGFDIYSSQKIGNTWTNPVNLGSKINTTENELFPFIDTDSSLYFSSEAHTNIGGLDIFKAQVIAQNQYSEPSNAGIPLNSSQDDFGVYAQKGEIKYISSNRIGLDEIYYIKTIQTKTRIAIMDMVVVNAENKAVPFAVVMIGEKDSVITDSNGYVRLSNLKLDTQYVFNAHKEGMVNQSYTLNVPAKLTQDTTIFLARVNMKPVPVQTQEMVNLELENIYYNFDKYNIRKDAYKSLEKIADFMVKNPTVTIELISHCDSRGTDEYNLELSKNRSRSVVSTLISLGVNADNITAFYMGKRMLANECGDKVNCSEALHQLNRRTVFTLNNELSKMLDQKYQLGKADLKPVDLRQFKSDKATSSNAAPLQTTSGTKQYYLVAGSFTQTKNVHDFVEELKAKGYNDVFVVKSENSPNYRIAIARFDDKDKAKNEIAKIKETQPEMVLWVLFE